MKTTQMRRLSPLLAMAFGVSVLGFSAMVPAHAQTKADKAPAPKMEPLPEPPPPPPGVSDAETGPDQVTIIRRGEDKVEEHRRNGKLYMLKVTPPHGVPYYMIDDRGDGTWSRQESTDSGVRVPMWVIKTF